MYDQLSLRNQLKSLLSDVLGYMRMDEIREQKRLLLKKKRDGRRIFKVIDGVEYINPQEFCRLFYCSLDDARKFRKQGMPAYKDGRQYLYNVELCQAWFRGE